MKKLLFVILLCCLPSVLIAQSWTYNPAASNAIMIDVQHSGVMASVVKSNADETVPSQNESGDDSPDVHSTISPTFIPSASRTRKNLQSFADKTRASDPAQADKMEALFASADVIGQIGDVMANFGLSRNNAADTFAVYWVSAWQAANSDTSTPSKAMVKAVAAQAARGLSQSPEFAAANDAQKQEMAEALMLQAALIDGHMEEAAGNAAQLNAVAKAVKQGASASGLELDTMTLTEEGFREGGPRKRSDASNTGESEKALAANENSRNAILISNNYIFISIS